MKTFLFAGVFMVAFAVNSSAASGACGFDPRQIYGLVAWYDATDSTTLFADAGTTLATDGGTVQQWNDKSGSGWNLKQATAGNRPTYRQYQWGGAVAFNFSHWLFNTNVSVVSPRTLVIRHYNPFPGSGSWPSANAVILGGNGSSTFCVLHAFSSAGGIESDINEKIYNGVLTANVPLRSSISHLNVCVFNGTSSQWRSDKVVKTPTSFGTDTLTPLSVGAYSGGAQPTYGMVGEILVYNRVLTASEIAVLETYGFDAALFNGGRDLVMFAGDSITRGTGGTPMQDWPQQTINGFTRNIYWFNRAIPTQTIAQQDSAAPTDVDTYLSVRNQVNVLVFLAGTNDLAGDSASVATVEARMGTYCTNRRTAGWNKIILGTLLPRVAGGNFSVTTRSNFNVWLRANYTTFADGLIDFGADATIGCDNCFTNTTYFGGDQIHPTAAGYTVMSTVGSPVISGVIP